MEKSERSSLLSLWYGTGFPGGPVVENLPANSGDIGDVGSIPRSGRSLNGMAIQSSILAWEIPWTEEPDELKSMGSQRAGHD